MKSFLVIGLGRFGRSTAEKLIELRHEVLAVDMDEDRVNEIMPFVTDAMIGDATKESFISTLGVDNFDVCIVAIGDNFQSSLECTALLKEHRARYVVARANGEVHKKFLLNNGADEVVYPEGQLAEWLAVRCSSERIFDYIELDSESAIYEVAAPEDWDGKPLSHLNIRRKYGINVIGIREENGVTMEISPDLILTAGQRIYVAGNKKTIKKIFS
ncbi:MAG: TrkA family potassium uptake protein [Lachnospiraceae bacterium]|nr:TrkA family potassium uptake protein [Lachnospiraceae bacterium]